jgi:hypothetical protein
MPARIAEIFVVDAPVTDNASDEGYDAAAARLERALVRLDASVRSLNGRVRAHARI